MRGTKAQPHQPEAKVAPQSPSRNGHKPSATEKPTYDVAPDGLVTFQGAASELGYTAARYNSWVKRGLLQTVGYLNKPIGERGRPQHLVRRSDVEAVHQSRNRRGVPIYTAAPEGLVTINEAAALSGIGRDRVATWVQRGFLRDTTVKPTVGQFKLRHHRIPQ